MTSYEARRLENIRRNTALVEDLGLKSNELDIKQAQQPKQPPLKRRKGHTGQPIRASARIASSTRPTYTEGALEIEPKSDSRRSTSRKTASSRTGLVS